MYKCICYTYCNETKESVLLKEMNKIRPARKVVVVTPREVKRGKILDYSTEKAQETGEVIAVGEGKLPIDLKVGDIIAYRRFGEAEYYLEGNNYFFIDFKDILAVIK